MVEFAMVGGLFIFMVMGMITLSLYVFEVQAANWAVQAAARWAVAAENFQPLASPQILLPACGPNSSPAGSPPAKMLSAAQQAAGPFGANITTATMTTGFPDTTEGTIGCVVTVTLPYRAFGLPFGLSLGNVTATATDYVT